MRSKKHGEGRQIIFDHSKHLAIKRSKLRWLMLFILHRVVLLRCAIVPRTTARKSWSMSSLQIGQGMVLWLLEYFFNFGELQGPPAVLPGELGVPPIPNRERRSINKNALLGDRCLTGHLLHLLYSRSRWSDLNMVTSIYMDPEVTVSGSCQPLSQDCKRG